VTGFGWRITQLEAFKLVQFPDPFSFQLVKKTIRIVSIALASLIVFGGAACHKNAGAQGGAKTLEQGVTDMRAVLVSASPQVQSNFYHVVSYNIRYGDYAKAADGLQSIASDPSLNDQQKKVVNEVSDLLKQAIENKQNTAAPAH